MTDVTLMEIHKESCIDRCVVLNELGELRICVCVAGRVAGSTTASFIKGHPRRAVLHRVGTGAQDGECASFLYSLPRSGTCCCSLIQV